MAGRDDDGGARLRRALEVLERSLEAPVVPGETEPWAEAVRAAVEEAYRAFADHADRAHPRALQQIADTDPGLLHRVQRMKEEDGSLLGRWERALAEARELVGAAGAEPGHESELRSRFEVYVAATLDLVIRTRTQESAIATWTREAFQRDRGGGD
jgi:hypothetical protein